MNSLEDTVDKNGLCNCKVCGSPPILDKIAMLHGWGFVYRCPTCPPAVNGVKISYSQLEAKIEWNKR